MKLIDLSIIIVSYNTKKITIECIESIISSTKNISYEIIVVDNASSDGTIDEIKKLQSHIKNTEMNLHLIENKENFGFSKANNIGVNKSKGKYVLFLNSDTVVFEKTLEKMVLFMEENESCGASTCYVELPNGKIDDAAHRGFPTPWNSYAYFSGLSKIFPKSKLFASYNLSFLSMDTTHEIDACAGAFMLVRRTAGEEVHWWDEEYFWYGEDIDFCYRLKEKGWKIYFVPTCKILHYKGVSGGIKKDSEHLSKATNDTRKRATVERFRAMELFYNKHYIHKYPKFITSLVKVGIKLKLNQALRKMNTTV